MQETVELLKWDAPGPYVVAFSTRRGGVSPAPYDSLNLGRRTDDPANIVENRRRVCASLGVNAESAAIGSQVHSSIVCRADAATVGVLRPDCGSVQCDGLWSEVPGQAVMVLAADCLPIVLVRLGGPKPAVAALHAGWRGLWGGILSRGVGTLGGRIAAVIGPSIGPCCYEVQADVSVPFTLRYGADVMRGTRLDLWTAAERQLRGAGVNHVYRFDLCTACNRDRFFSARRDGLTGGQAVVAVVA